MILHKNTNDEAQLRAAEALLEFYLHAGVDIALETTAGSYFASKKNAGQGQPTKSHKAPNIRDESGKKPPDVSAKASERPARQSSGKSSDQGLNQGSDQGFGGQKAIDLGGDQEAHLLARKAARTASDLGILEKLLIDFEGCRLKDTALNTVFGEGDSSAAVMLIGEAPGREEDRQGRPFIGRSGQLLDKMLMAAGLPRESCRISNIVPWRPPGNRAPSTAEIEICAPFILRQIELVSPKILVLLGGSAANALLDGKSGILTRRGQWDEVEIGVRKFATMATLHPAYLLRDPTKKRLAWQDILAVKHAVRSSA